MSIFYMGMGSSKAADSLISLDSPKLEEHIKEKEDMWVYIGRPTCEECDRFSPVLEEVLKENDKSIYYYNTDDAVKEGEQEMIDMLDKLEVNLVPTLIYLKEGKVVKSAVGYQDKASLEKLLKN